MDQPPHLHHQLQQGKVIACKNYILIMPSQKDSMLMIFFRDTESIIGLVIFILCVLYSSIRTASNSQAAKLSGSDKILLKDVGEGGNSDPEANKVWDNEEDEVAYSWSLFHAMFALATVNSTNRQQFSKLKKIKSRLLFL